MYQFSPYWNDKTKIDFLQRVVLIHSYLYYELDRSILPDRKYDEIAKQLADIQNNHSALYIKRHTQYGYAFYDFDGTTGFDLFDRLDSEDKAFIKQIAEAILMEDHKL